MGLQASQSCSLDMIRNERTLGHSWLEMYNFSLKGHQLGWLLMPAESSRSTASISVNIYSVLVWNTVFDDISFMNWSGPSRSPPSRSGSASRALRWGNSADDMAFQRQGVATGRS